MTWIISLCKVLERLYCITISHFHKYWLFGFPYSKGIFLISQWYFITVQPCNIPSKKKKLEVPSAKSLCTTSRSQLLKLNLQFTRDLQSIEHSLCINRDVCSQKHRRAEVGSIFASLCPALTPAGPPTADAQAALEDLQGGVPIPPWSLCQCSATHTALKCCWMFSGNLRWPLVLALATTEPCLTLPSSHPPSGICRHWWDPLSLIFYRLSSPSFLSLYSQEGFSCPFTILMALCWTFSSMSLSVLSWEAQNWSTTGVSHQLRAVRKPYLSWPAGNCQMVILHQHFLFQVLKLIWEECCCLPLLRNCAKMRYNQRKGKRSVRARAVRDLTWWDHGKKWGGTVLPAAPSQLLKSCCLQKATVCLTPCGFIVFELSSNSYLVFN